MRTKAESLAKLSEWREANPERVAEMQRAIVARNAAIIEDHKRQPCMDCGGEFPPVAMDFDHVRGVKSAGLSWLATHTVSVERIMAELAKCDLVCANCHRIRTQSRRQAVA